MARVAPKQKPSLQIKTNMNLKNCFRLTVASGVFFALTLSVAVADDNDNESHYIGILQTQSSPAEKDAACVWLKRHGTAQCVPALASLLNDEQLSHSARYALESLPGPEAEKALIASLSQTSGLQKAGVIESLGIRRDEQAVPALIKLLADPDELTFRVAASSLGDIASRKALKALESHLNETDQTRKREIIDGCFRCAQADLAAGNRKQALAVYKEIYNQPAQEFLHVAAYRGMVLASGRKGVDLMVDAILNGPAPLQMEAIQLAHEVPNATGALAKLLPNVNPLTQVALIDALGQRNDPAAVPEIVALTKSENSDVRIAAVTALGTLGSDKELPVLIDIASTTTGPIQTAARQALSLIHRGNPNKTLVDMLAGAKPETQVEILKALASRSAIAATPQLLQLAQTTDGQVQDAAFEALARLVSQSQLPALVQIVDQMKTDAGRASAAQAVVAACRHIQREHDTVDMAPVWTALRNGSPDMRVALLPVCSGLTDTTAREVLRASIKDSDSKVRAAAIRALCDTMDAALVGDIVQLVGDSAADEFHTALIEAFVRLTTQDDATQIQDSTRMQMFQKVAPLAKTPAEKRVVLSGLVMIADAPSLELAGQFVSDEAVTNEAARAVISICRTLPDAAAAQAALAKFISETKDDQARQDAEAALKLIEARAKYITVWQYAGPYRQAGKDYRALFDIAFPPEKADAQGIDWRPLPTSDDPKTPWAMDLLKMMGGEQEVAYARTSIHSNGEQSGQLLINSDDGVKVWLNGEVIHEHNVSRALGGKPDKVKITLKPGWNNLLLKITQNNMGWGFAVRLTDAEGAQIQSVQYAASPAHNQM